MLGYLVDNPQLTISIVALSVSLVSGYCAFSAYRRQLFPDVILYLEPEQSMDFPCVNLIVENIGNGCARNISFTLSKDFPMNVFVGGPHNDLPYGALGKGIPFLPPGGKRVFLWGSYGSLCEHFGKDVVETITVRFKTNSRLPDCLRRSFKADYPIELGSLFNVSSISKKSGS